MMKAVTIMGFAPSLNLPYQAEGEVWTMNQGWDIFRDLPLADKITRIYEMHCPSKVKDKPSQIDGKPHWEQLNELGKKGIQIYLQDINDEIANCKRYQIEYIEADMGVSAVRRYTGRDFWGGTTPYMLANAIWDRYDKIHLVGCDMSDLKHRRQREAIAYLWGIAKERGIEITGITMTSDRPTKRYGYDYGPEWDEYQQAIEWENTGVDLRIVGHTVPILQK